jgi:hypothetical protein
MVKLPGEGVSVAVVVGVVVWTGTTVLGMFLAVKYAVPVAAIAISTTPAMYI